MAVPWVTALERGEGLRNFMMWILPGMPDSAAAVPSTQMLAVNDMGLLLAAVRAMGGLVVGRDVAGRIRAPAVVAVGTGDDSGTGPPVTLRAGARPPPGSAP